MKKYIIFEYLYRDASNYKAWGSLVLRGGFKSSDLDILKSKFEAGIYFIAEQLQIPPLYVELWRYSDGPTVDDHVWHEFSLVRLANEEDVILPVFSTVRAFIDNIGLINNWNPKLSPHWRVF